MVRKYYVVKAENGKEIEVVDSARDAEEKSKLVNGSYQTFSKGEARRIAKTTQWGLLPEDVHNFLPPRKYTTK